MLTPDETLLLRTHKEVTAGLFLDWANYKREGEVTVRFGTTRKGTNCVTGPNGPVCQAGAAGIF